MTEHPKMRLPRLERMEQRLDGLEQRMEKVEGNQVVQKQILDLETQSLHLQKQRMIEECAHRLESRRGSGSVWAALHWSGYVEECRSIYE